MFTLVLSVTIFLYLLLMWKAQKTYPILYLFFFTYFIQYVFSTWLIYNEYDVLSYQMPIDQEAYFSYVIPALLFLFAGVLFFTKDFQIAELVKRIRPKQASRLGYLLMFISYFFDLIMFLGVPFADSVGSFTTYLKYIAAFCFLFTDNRFNYIFIVIIFGQLAASVIGSGVFISFFVWATFLFFFIIVKYRLPFWIRVGVIIPFAFLLVIIQSVKKEYRQAIWQTQQGGNIDILTDLAQKKNTENADEPFSQSEGVVRTVGRLSQGWHLGLTLKRVPEQQDFANGSEMLSDITSSILPRVIFAGKKEVNSQEKFRKYTGHRLRGSTSMSIGILGDFYINYGATGSFIMLFIFGAMIARMLHFFFVRFVVPDPINIIWIPFLLSYLIRANNDFYIFFNCLVKGFLIFLLIDFLRYNVFGERKSVHTVITKVRP